MKGNSVETVLATSQLLCAKKFLTLVYSVCV